MRIFVYEHTCATAAPELAALRAEGAAMLRAVAEDFSQLEGVQVVTLDGQLAGLSQPAAHAASCTEAAGADFTLVIAPESDGILLNLCRQVETVGGRLLGPAPPAVQLAADKLALAKHWQQHGVRTPACRLLLPQENTGVMFGPAVLKPRHGAGSQATFLIREAAELDTALRQADAEGNRDELIVQPFVPGRPVSVAWLIGPKERVPLLPADQDLSTDGRFHYRGGSLPLAAEMAERAIRLSRLAIESVPGLLGYVGVDLILGAAADGSEDFAIELNPRLTTSYIGLRVLARDNLALAMLRAAQGDTIELSWKPGAVRFLADGSVTY